MEKGKCAPDLSSRGVFIVNKDPANDVRFFQTLFPAVGSLCALRIRNAKSLISVGRKKARLIPTILKWGM